MDNSGDNIFSCSLFGLWDDLSYFFTVNIFFFSSFMLDIVDHIADIWAMFSPLKGIAFVLSGI